MVEWSGNFLRVREGHLVEFHVRNHETSIVSSFHVIGEIFDNAYAEAGSTPTHRAARHV